MREFLRPLRPWLLSATLLFSPTSERRVDPHTDNSSEVETAVGFVNALVEKRGIDALLGLNPHRLLEMSIIGSARLTDQEEDTLKWLRLSVIPLFKGCRISDGVGLENLQVRVNFEEPCGNKWTYPLEGVNVQLAYTEEGPYPTSLLTFLHNRGVE